jgi:hypothetical protein
MMIDAMSAPATDEAVAAVIMNALARLDRYRVRVLAQVC